MTRLLIFALISYVVAFPRLAYDRPTILEAPTAGVRRR